MFKCLICHTHCTSYTCTPVRMPWSLTDEIKLQVQAAKHVFPLKAVWADLYLLFIRTDLTQLLVKVL